MEIKNLNSINTSNFSEYLNGKINRRIYDIVDTEIDERLKEINPQLVLLYNKSKKQYEVHHMGYYLRLGVPSSTYLCGWNYSGKPDHRLINHVIETLSRTAEEALKIVMDNNNNLDRISQSRFREDIEYAVKSGFKQVNSNTAYSI